MPAEPRARVFFALWPSTAEAERLAGLAERLMATCGGRAMRADTLHLTLAFVGDIAETRLPDLAAVPRGLPVPDCSLELDQLGYWAPKHLVWAGCSAAPPALSAFALRLRERLGAAGFAVDRGPSGFFPHVTLLRKAGAAPLEAWPVEPLRWEIPRCVLVRSQLSAAGANYRILESYPSTSPEFSA